MIPISYWWKGNWKNKKVGLRIFVWYNWDTVPHIFIKLYNEFNLQCTEHRIKCCVGSAVLGKLAIFSASIFYIYNVGVLKQARKPSGSNVNWASIHLFHSSYIPGHLKKLGSLSEYDQLLVCSVNAAGITRSTSLGDQLLTVSVHSVFASCLII